MTARQLLKEAKKALKSANDRFGYRGDEEEQAWDLLVHACGYEPDDDEVIGPLENRRFWRLIGRRTTGEPMAYITGWIDFKDFRMHIKPGAFVPRLTSEFLADQAIRRLRRRSKPVHVDVAAGIGPVAISSSRAVPHASVWGLDISQKAVNQARKNAARLCDGNITFKRSDMFAALPASLKRNVDVITIHPPYVPRRMVRDLPVEIMKFEPGHTLTDGSSDGLKLVRRTIDEGRHWIKPGGWLLIEITPGEFKLIRPLLRQAGYGGIRSTKGPLGFTRVIVARA